MSMKGSGVGLCMNCSNAEGCEYRARRGADVTYCEMFEERPRNGGDSDIRSGSGSMKTEAAKPVEVMGLCLNCKHRDSCQLSRPETGVWHCEEYE